MTLPYNVIYDKRQFTGGRGETVDKGRGKW